MATICQFVDAISASPTVRLDLNALTAGVGLMIGEEGLDLTPPEMRVLTSPTFLADGEHVIASAAGNRVVGVPLRLFAPAASPDSAATVLQNLGRELDRPTNILKVQLHGMSSPVFFRTIRATGYEMQMMRNMLAHNTAPKLALPADPYAYGLRVDLAPVNVSNDPNAANGRFMDITGVQGDVSTPLRVDMSGSTLAGRQSLFAVRRRGTPSGAPFFLQAESMTQGTDTTVTGATDATGGGASPSGAASNSSATTFTTNNMTVTRLSTAAFPSSPTVEARGQYRVFVRVRPGTAAATFSIQLEHGVRGVLNTARTTEVTTTTYTMVDLGLIQLPEGVDPVTDGPGGATLSVVGVPLELHAQRLSGSGTLVWDYLMFVPADDRQGIMSWGTTAPSRFIVDGNARAVYGQDASGRIADVGMVGLSAEFPAVSPGVTNRLVFIRDVSPNPSSSDAIATTVGLTCSYWPRYLFVRPVST